MRKVDLEGVKIGLCQMRCVPADPMRNAQKFIRHIEEAEAEGVDILVGPEGLQGYLIGDQYEYRAFLQEVDLANRQIREAVMGKKLVVAYGSVLAQLSETGEDGRFARINGGLLIFDEGVTQAANFKTLSPNYRMFAESRYFLDNRKLGEAWQTPIEDMLKPWPVTLRDGRVVNIGQEFCEDMWHQDYAINPSQILAENGADIIINHSASPWTWRKNNKRHRVVKQLMTEMPEAIRPKLFVYVNRVGVEQSAKNFYIYDGSSAVYDSDGDLIHECLPYQESTSVFTFSSTTNWKIKEHTPDDTKALYDAMAEFIDASFGKIPDEYRWVYVGLSGGIDSSVVAAMLASRPCLYDRVLGVNMPYGNFNSKEGKNDAEQLGQRLAAYLVVDITEMVDQIAWATKVESGTLDHQNIQARCRMEVLAALAQKEETIGGLVKKGGRFTANGNKDEMTFGYGTMYGDVAGAVMPLVDLTKREVYQLGNYLNHEIYKKPPIPNSIFERQPTAELDMEHSSDPFDYGNLDHRGYHDEWVRAVTEFRWDPVRFLREYLDGTLEKSMLLPDGHIAKLFSSARSFVLRLERDWSSFTNSYWKRMQCPPGPVFTRRAYGGDLTESMYAFPPTAEYRRLKDQVLALDTVTK